MSNARIYPMAVKPVHPMMLLSIGLQLGASVALARLAVPAEAHAEPELGAAITPSAQAISYAIWNLRQRQSLLQGDYSPEEVFSMDTWSEAELDYSHIDHATRAAIHAPAIQVSEDDKRMYMGLSAPRFAFDEEAIPVDRTRIAIAERQAAHAPAVVLGDETLQALTGIQTSFPRSIELDYSDMDRATRVATCAPAIEIFEGDDRMYAGLSTPYFAFEDGFDEE